MLCHIRSWKSKTLEDAPSLLNKSCESLTLGLEREEFFSFATTTYNVKDAIISLAMVCLEIDVVYIVVIKEPMSQKTAKAWPTLEGMTGRFEKFRKGWEQF